MKGQRQTVLPTGPAAATLPGQSGANCPMWNGTPHSGQVATLVSTGAEPGPFGFGVCRGSTSRLSVVVASGARLPRPAVPEAPVSPLPGPRSAPVPVRPFSGPASRRRPCQFSGAGRVWWSGRWGPRWASPVGQGAPVVRYGETVQKARWARKGSIHISFWARRASVLGVALSP